MTPPESNQAFDLACALGRILGMVLDASTGTGASTGIVGAKLIKKLPSGTNNYCAPRGMMPSGRRCCVMHSIKSV